MTKCTEVIVALVWLSNVRAVYATDAPLAPRTFWGTPLIVHPTEYLCSWHAFCALSCTAYRIIESAA